MSSAIPEQELAELRCKGEIKTPVRSWALYYYESGGSPMVAVVVYKSLPGREGYDVLAEASVTRGKLSVDGRRQDLVDTSRRVYSSRDRRYVTFDGDGEEWLRSFAETFRTAQVGAVITKDTVHRDLEAPRDFVERLDEAARSFAASH